MCNQEEFCFDKYAKIVSWFNHMMPALIDITIVVIILCCSCSVVISLICEGVLFCMEGLDI